jgi:hypothetical protein
MDYMARLRECGFAPEGQPEPPDSVAKLEQLIGVPLPSEYRKFLLEIGGGHLNARVPCMIPTPFGSHGVSTLHSVDEVIYFLDSALTPRNMICIGYGDFGATTCLSVAGLDHGQVFSLDTEARFYWDEEVLSRFPHMDPEIRDFFRLRDAGELPSRPWGYENCYHVADSLPEFFSKLRPE